MPYRYAKRGVIFFLVLYFLVGIFAEIYTSGELYPVFSWRLFAIVPNEVVKHTIEISVLGETTYDPPLKFSDTGFLFKRISQSPTDYERTIENLGSAIRISDDFLILKHRAEIESIFATDTFEYSVVQISYDSLEYWETRSYKVDEVLAVFRNNEI